MFSLIFTNLLYAYLSGVICLNKIMDLCCTIVLILSIYNYVYCLPACCSLLLFIFFWVFLIERLLQVFHVLALSMVRIPIFSIVTSSISIYVSRLDWLIVITQYPHSKPTLSNLCAKIVQFSLLNANLILF